jgi:hypothetical protein
MGVPLELVTNAPLLAEYAESVFGGWGTKKEGTLSPSVTLNLFIHDEAESFAGGAPPPPLLRAQGPYFFVNAGKSMAFADRATGFATAFVTQEMARCAGYVRSLFIETLGIYMVQRYRPATLHAAAIVHGDKCILLTGADGAGKSTLTFACIRAGFKLLAEDVVFGLEEEGRLRVWGNPWKIHLLWDAIRFFPELATHEPEPQLNGEWKLCVPIDSVRLGAAALTGGPCGVISLGRSGHAGSEINGGNPANIRRALLSFKGDPPVDWEAMETAAALLARGRTAHLNIGTNLEEAVAVIREWIEAA